jgi:hypothetical protein
MDTFHRLLSSILETCIKNDIFFVSRCPALIALDLPIAGVSFEQSLRRSEEIEGRAEQLLWAALMAGETDAVQLVMSLDQLWALVACSMGPTLQTQAVVQPLLTRQLPRLLHLMTVTLLCVRVRLRQGLLGPASQFKVDVRAFFFQDVSECLGLLEKAHIYYKDRLSQQLLAQVHCHALLYTYFK